MSAPGNSRLCPRPTRRGVFDGTPAVESGGGVSDGGGHRLSGVAVVVVAAEAAQVVGVRAAELSPPDDVQAVVHGIRDAARRVAPEVVRGALDVRRDEGQ